MLKKYFLKYFIPHEGNDHKPHSLRGLSVGSAIALTISLQFVVPFFYPALLDRINFTATILPSVLVDLSNDNRETLNALPLQLNPVLEKAAELKANDMAGKGYFAHTSPEGIAPWHWFKVAGYEFSYAGENLAVNFSDSEEVVDAWMNSPLHRANILDSRFTEIGIATAKGVHDGREAIFVVQLFGTPSSALTIASKPSAETPPVSENQLTRASQSEAAVKGEKENQETVSRQSEELFAKSDYLSYTPAPSSPVPLYSSKFEQLITAPKTMLYYIYMMLLILASIALALSVFIEIRKQHFRHILHGFLFVSVVVLAIAVNQSQILSSIIIR